MLVCGDAAASLFTENPLRQVAGGLYLHVADEEQLIRQAEVLLADRPAWASQLCVACTVVPVVHLDMAVLAGRLRRFVGGLATVRRRAGIKVPLLLWSWLPGTGREDDLPWFICAGGKVQVVTPAGESSPTAWAAQPGTDGSSLRLCHLLRMESLMQWLNQMVLPELNGYPPLAAGMGQAPSLPALEGNLWQTWTTAKTGLTPEAIPKIGASPLPFPDMMLPLLPRQSGFTPVRRACVAALLMMSRPEKSDAAFFSTTLMAEHLRYAAVPEGIRQSVLPSLLTFWMANLPEHPQWKIAPQPQLTSAVRKILLRQIGVRNAENTLYQNVLKQVSRNYADITLADMTGDTLADPLFSTEQTVPGMFTRQAWEGQVKEAIEQVVTARREEIDWVLSDRRQDASADISPEVLRARLTTRYFTDFAGSWQAFLNSIRWKKEDSLSGVLDQLTLMADARQSPLIALTDTVAWQAATGRESAGLSDSLVKSAKALFNGKENTSHAVRKDETPAGPMDKTFAPLLRLIGDTTGGRGDTQLSLQTWLTRVTRVRLKLQQVINAPDPQEMTQQLAQTVFQGKTVDLTDTRDYGRLIAASLGEEWSGFGQSLFVSPVEQAWRQVLTPAADSLNRQWQRAIVNLWEQDFAGRYPFKDTANDASLPLLAQYLRDDGRINQFIATNLTGMLKREGRYWVADTMNTQGLAINPAFLRALNRLRDVADTAFASGDAGVHFELMAKPARDVMKTHLVIDGQQLEYFNQKERWQRFSWPHEQWQPGASLSWTSTQNMERILADFRGSWSFIRLLEQAQVTQLDSSSFKLQWQAPDGLPLHYLMRVEQGKGPLALLTLKNFRLPGQLFLTEKGAADRREYGEDE